MTVQLDFFGASGAAYRYMARDGTRLSPSGGNYIFARESETGLAVIYVGQVENLMTMAEDLWPQAVAEHGATHAFVRLNITASVRRRELEDLVAAYDPPMNQAEPGEAASNQTSPQAETDPPAIRP